MLINKKSKGKKQPKINTESKSKITKPHQKEQKPRLPPRPQHHISTLSLLNNHNASQCSLISEGKPKLSAGKGLRLHRQSSTNLLNKSSGKLKKKGKKSFLKKSPTKASPLPYRKKPQHRDQAYQRIIVAQYNSKSHSQINFSHNTSERDRKMPPKSKKILTIDCSDDCILSQYFTNNAIKYSERKKSQAAVKIQKVFRGYLTRRMLQDFIQKEEAKIYQLSLKIKKSPITVKQNSYFKQSPIKSSSKKYKSFEEQQFGDEFQISLRNENSIQKIDHGPLLEQSSIYGCQDSISKYLPGDSHTYEYQSRRDTNDYITYSEALQRMQKQPIISPSRQTSLNKAQQPIPTDFSEKKVSDFYTQFDFRKNREVSANSNENVSKDEKKQQKLYSKQSEQTKSKQKQLIHFLKKEEQKKWGKVIEMLNQHITQSTSHNNDLQDFMKAILDYSKKNKQDLEKTYLMYSDKKNKSFSHEELNKVQQQIKIDHEKDIQINLQIQQMSEKKTDNMIDILKQESCFVEKIRKNQDMPLLRRKNTKESSPCNIYEKTQQLKKYFRKSLTNYPVEEMIQIRQKALEKRQKQMVNKLNQDLQKSSISHQKFLARLGQMQDKFQQQKQLINRAKMQIFLGHQAVNKLVKDSFLDARYLGFKVPFSQSLKDIKSTNCLWIKQIIVDQLKQFHKSNKKQDNLSAIKHDEKQQNSNLSLKVPSESHSIELSNTIVQDQLSYNEGAIQNAHHKFQNMNSFSEEFNQSQSQDESEDLVETAPRFKRIHPFSSKVVSDQNNLLYNKSRQQFEKQILIQINTKSDDKRNNQLMRHLRQYEMTPRNTNPVINQPKSEVYNVSFQSSSSGQQIIFDEDMDPTICQITQAQIAQLIWQSCGQIFQNSHMWRKFNKPKNKLPTKIKQNQRMLFVENLFGIIPGAQHLIEKLNQKMTPSKMELLKYMRVSLEENSSMSQSEQFEQIGKYQLVFSPQICLQAIQIFIQSSSHDKYDSVKQPQQVSRTLNGKVSQACIQKVIQRQKFQVYSNNQRKDLRDEIQKIQMHCIFDALNQTILKIRSRTIGYSGIGLNQLSSLLSGNGQQLKQITSQSQVQRLLVQSKQQLLQITSDTKTSNQKIFTQNYEDLCKNDSQWIQYSDQALSFALELVFMVEDQFFMEEVRQMASFLPTTHQS